MNQTISALFHFQRKQGSAPLCPDSTKTAGFWPAHALSPKILDWCGGPIGETGAGGQKSSFSNLATLVEEQLEIVCHSPLAILNLWLEQGLVAWSEEMQTVLTQWVSQEKPQPANEFKRFEGLTAQEYPRFTKIPLSRSKPQK